MQQYVCYNGTYHKVEDPILKHNNRGFLYGDAIFETMRANGKNIHFFSDHIARAYHSMKELKMDIPQKIEDKSIEKEIVKLLNKNRHLKGARIRLTLFRDAGGKYTPENNSVSYLIESEALESDVYKLNEKGLIIDVFQEYKKQMNLLSNLKTTNDLIYILAGIFKKENGVDECVIMNERNFITESISSNIFLVKGNILKTPSLKSGCLNGIMRKQVLEFAEEIGLKIALHPEISPEELLHCDEVILTNTVKGIQWVSGFRHIRYYKQVARQLAEKLKEKTKIED
jgi:branched-chain amino acid aminotransferase